MSRVVGIATEQPSVLVESDARVVQATLNRPASRNCINPALLDGLEAAVDEAVVSGARVFVLRATGPAFCAGADLKYVRLIREDAVAFEAFIERIGRLLDRIETGPFAAVAIVDGVAVAGGCEIVLAFDVVIASSRARLGDGHVEYGLVPGAGGSVRLFRNVSAATARYLLLTGDMMSGHEAAACGLVHTAVDAEELDEVAERVIGRLAGRSREGLACVKQMIAAAHSMPVEEAIAYERKLCVQHLVNSPNVEEGLDAFITKRPPNFE